MMPTQISQDDFVRALTMGRRGQFYTKLSPGEWIGMDGTGVHPRMVRGAFADVIESFVPYSGMTRIVSDIMDGVMWDGNTVRRMPMDEYRKGKKSTRKAHEVRKGD